jgi:hypothetical protein
MSDLPMLGLDAMTLDAIAPTPTPTKDEKFSVLKEKMMADDYALVDAVIRKVQENGGTRVKTIANVFRDWAPRSGQRTVRAVRTYVSGFRAIVTLPM